MARKTSHTERESIIIDLEARVRELTLAMEAHRKSEEGYKAILEGIEDGYYEVDLEGNTTFFNESYLAILGYSADEMRGMNYKQYVTGDTAKVIFETFNGVYRTGTPSKALDWPLTRKDGTIRFVEISVSLIRDMDGKPTGFRGIMRDITSRTQVENELRMAKIKAEEANVAKSEFLANMSHEIRTPLNAVIGFSDILSESGLNPKQQEFTEAIRKNADVLLGLLNDILDFAKIEAGMDEILAIDFDPELVVYDVLEKVKPKMQDKPIELLCRIDDTLPALVNGDPVRLRHILSSLIGNASKFTSKGEIELSVDVTAIRDNQADLHIKVRDTGIGISQEKLDIVFEPFRQADGSATRRYSGTGLGLAMCKKLLKRMGGSIRVESDYGSATTFHVTLSVDLAECAPGIKPQFASLTGQKILVVDDNAANLTILSNMLEIKGVRVVTLKDSALAVPLIQEAAQGGDAFALAVIDIQMPLLSGYKVAEAIRSQNGSASAMTLLALSSMVEKDALACHAAGFDGFLNKPVNRLKLYQMIEALLGKGRQTQNQASETGEMIMTQYSIRENLKHSIRILYAEDNPVNQKVAITLLTKAGYQVDIAVNGREAVDRFIQNPSGYDLILMDIQMPELDGLKATQILREKGYGKVPIVALTANAVKGDRESCLSAGMNDYLAKPIRREKIFEIIKKWCF